MTNSALVAEDVHKSFGSLEVLKGVSMTAHEGDVIAMLWGFRKLEHWWSGHLRVRKDNALAIATEGIQVR